MYPLLSASNLPNSALILPCKYTDDIRGLPQANLQYTHLILSMQSLPELGKLAEVNPHVAILVSRVDESLGLGVSHLPADLADEGDQLLGGDHAVTVGIEEFECLQGEQNNVCALLYGGLPL